MNEKFFGIETEINKKYDEDGESYFSVKVIDGPAIGISFDAGNKVEAYKLALAIKMYASAMHLLDG